MSTAKRVHGIENSLDQAEASLQSAGIGIEILKDRGIDPELVATIERHLSAAHERVRGAVHELAAVRIELARG